MTFRHWLQWDTLECCGLENSLGQEMGDGWHCQLWAFGESQFTWISLSDGSNAGSRVDGL